MTWTQSGETAANNIRRVTEQVLTHQRTTPSARLVAVKLCQYSNVTNVLIWIVFCCFRTMVDGNRKQNINLQCFRRAESLDLFPTLLSARHVHTAFQNKGIFADMWILWFPTQPSQHDSGCHACSMNGTAQWEKHVTNSIESNRWTRFEHERTKVVKQQKIWIHQTWEKPCK